MREFVATLGQASDRAHIGSAAEVNRLLNSGAMSQVICVAAELRIADALAGGRRNAGDLARDTEAHAPSLHRLMRALTSLELCTEHDDGSFSLTPMGALLRADAPDSLRSWSIWCGTHMRSIWGNLLHSVKTGQRATELFTGSEAFELGAEAAATFHQAMAEITRLAAREVMRVYDFAGMRRIVDVGGGHGALITTILEAYPRMNGVLFDLPHAIEGVRSRLESTGLTKRCELISGDFFDSIPPNADAYLLKTVIHDWDDERCAIILRNCRRAIPQNGKLLLIERVVPRRFAPSSLHHAIARADLTMLVAHSGRERTEVEFNQLFDSSGFKLDRLIETGTEFSVLEGVPI
jgi:ubiquinone/menaquinone biosynthesis C-methylase UbiE